MDVETKKLKKNKKDVYDDKITGKITNIQLLKTMQLDEIISYGDGRTHKKGTAKIGGIVKELKNKGYIIIHHEIPALEKIPLGGGRYGPDKKITVSQVMYEITPAGRRQAKDAMMDKE